MRAITQLLLVGALPLMFNVGCSGTTDDKDTTTEDSVPDETEPQPVDTVDTSDTEVYGGYNYLFSLTTIQGVLDDATGEFTGNEEVLWLNEDFTQAFCLWGFPNTEAGGTPPTATCDACDFTFTVASSGGFSHDGSGETPAEWVAFTDPKKDPCAGFAAYDSNLTAAIDHSWGHEADYEYNGSFYNFTYLYSVDLASWNAYFLADDFDPAVGEISWTGINAVFTY